MKTIVALIVALLALPASAGQDHSAWWNCATGYLAKRNLVDGKPLDSIAVDAVFACEDVSLRQPSDDYDVVLQWITRYRGYHNEAPAAAKTSAPNKYDAAAEEMARERRAAPRGDLRF